MPDLYYEERARRHAEYLEIPVESRLKVAVASRDRNSARIADLEAERDGGGPTAWLAHRQLPHMRKMLETNLRDIKDCEEEIYMSTSFPEIFAALTEEFNSREVRTRVLGNRQLCYVTARTVMNRLDSVLGPENWRDEYTQLQNGVLCKLTIRLPDGEEITKSDAGGHAGMSDEGDDEKSGFSDAFKRAAVKFGVGRHLYGEGVPRYKPAPATTQKQQPKGPPKREHPAPAETAREMSGYDGPKNKKEFAEYLKAVDPDGSEGCLDFIREWGKRNGYPERINDWSPTHVMQAYPVLVRQIESLQAAQASPE